MIFLLKKVLFIYNVEIYFNILLIVKFIMNLFCKCVFGVFYFVNILVYFEWY